MTDDDTTLGALLRAAAASSATRVARAVAPYGVTAAEWTLLHGLHDAGAVAPSALARRLGITRGAVTKLVDRLRAKGLLVRAAAGRDDRRYRTIALTGAGALLVRELAAIVDAAEAATFAALAPRARTALAAALREIVARPDARSVRRA